MEARVLKEPALDDWGFVRREVVEHEVQVEVSGHGRVDGLQELAELLGAMAPVAFANH